MAFKSSSLQCACEAFLAGEKHVSLFSPRGEVDQVPARRSLWKCRQVLCSTLAGGHEASNDLTVEARHRGPGSSMLERCDCLWYNRVTSVYLRQKRKVSTSNVTPSPKDPKMLRTSRVPNTPLVMPAGGCPCPVGDCSRCFQGPSR